MTKPELQTYVKHLYGGQKWADKVDKMSVPQLYAVLRDVTARRQKLKEKSYAREN